MRHTILSIVAFLVLVPPCFAAGKPTAGKVRITQPVLFGTPESDKILASLQIFPPDNPWNTDVSRWPLHPNSRNIIASIGPGKPLHHNSDMNWVFVPPNQKLVPIRIVAYPGESDKGPFPIPDNLPIEDWPVGYKADLDGVQRDVLHRGNDRHGIIIDPTRGLLVEFYQALKTPAGWQCAQASVFDLKSNKLRPDGWTSADAAGLPIFPGTVRFDELQRGMVEHAIRVTVRRSRKACVYPATHHAGHSSDPNLPRMGERIRLRKDFPTEGFPPHVQAVLKGLKKYGMLVADNGMDWFISVAPDPRIAQMNTAFAAVKGADFEVVIAPR
ncbi:MAG: hypothetical protein ABSG68_18740 [Thermoguttaceae bacterium]|jgi:hypothetical protein